MTTSADRQKPPNRRSGPKVRQHHIKGHEKHTAIRSHSQDASTWIATGAMTALQLKSRRRCRNTAPAYPNADTAKAPHAPTKAHVGP